MRALYRQEGKLSSRASITYLRPSAGQSHRARDRVSYCSVFSVQEGSTGVDTAELSARCAERTADEVGRAATNAAGCAVGATTAWVRNRSPVQVFLPGCTRVCHRVYAVMIT